MSDDLSKMLERAAGLLRDAQNRVDEQKRVIKTLADSGQPLSDAWLHLIALEEAADACETHYAMVVKASGLQARGQ